MKVQDAYNFLKPSLDQYTFQEKKALCTLILGKDPVKKKRVDPIPTIPEIKRALLKTVFKKSG